MSSTLWLCLILLASTTSSHARPRASPGPSDSDDGDPLPPRSVRTLHQLKNMQFLASRAIEDAKKNAQQHLAAMRLKNMELIRRHFYHALAPVPYIKDRLENLGPGWQLPHPPLRVIPGMPLTQQSTHDLKPKPCTGNAFNCLQSANSPDRGASEAHQCVGRNCGRFLIKPLPRPIVNINRKLSYMGPFIKVIPSAGQPPKQNLCNIPYIPLNSYLHLQCNHEIPYFPTHATVQFTTHRNSNITTVPVEKTDPILHQVTTKNPQHFLTLPEKLYNKVVTSTDAIEQITKLYELQENILKLENEILGIDVTGGLQTGSKTETATTPKLQMEADVKESLYTTDLTEPVDPSKKYPAATEASARDSLELTISSIDHRIKDEEPQYSTTNPDANLDPTSNNDFGRTLDSVTEAVNGGNYDVVKQTHSFSRTEEDLISDTTTEKLSRSDSPECTDCNTIISEVDKEAISTQKTIVEPPKSDSTSTEHFQEQTQHSQTSSEDTNDWKFGVTDKELNNSPNPKIESPSQFVTESSSINELKYESEPREISSSIDEKEQKVTESNDEASTQTLESTSNETQQLARENFLPETTMENLENVYTRLAVSSTQTNNEEPITFVDVGLDFNESHHLAREDDSFETLTTTESSTDNWKKEETFSTTTEGNNGRIHGTEDSENGNNNVGMFTQITNSTETSDLAREDAAQIRPGTTTVYSIGLEEDVKIESRIEEESTSTQVNGLPELPRENILLDIISTVSTASENWEPTKNSISATDIIGNLFPAGIASNEISEFGREEPVTDISSTIPATEKRDLVEEMITFGPGKRKEASVGIFTDLEAEFEITETALHEDGEKRAEIPDNGSVMLPREEIGSETTFSNFVDEDFENKAKTESSIEGNRATEVDTEIPLLRTEDLLEGTKSSDESLTTTWKEETKLSRINEIIETSLDQFIATDNEQTTVMNLRKMQPSTTSHNDLFGGNVEGKTDSALISDGNRTDIVDQPVSVESTQLTDILESGTRIEDATELKKNDFEGRELNEQNSVDESLTDITPTSQTYSQDPSLDSEVPVPVWETNPSQPSDSNEPEFNMHSISDETKTNELNQNGVVKYMTEIENRTSTSIENDKALSIDPEIVQLNDEPPKKEKPEFKKILNEVLYPTTECPSCEKGIKHGQRLKRSNLPVVINKTINVHSKEEKNFAVGGENITIPFPKPNSTTFNVIKTDVSQAGSSRNLKNSLSVKENAEDLEAFSSVYASTILELLPVIREGCKNNAFSQEDKKVIQSIFGDIRALIDEEQLGMTDSTSELLMGDETSKVDEAFEDYDSSDAEKGRMSEEDRRLKRSKKNLQIVSGRVRKLPTDIKRVHPTKTTRITRSSGPHPVSAAAAILALLAEDSEVQLDRPDDEDDDEYEYYEDDEYDQRDDYDNPSFKELILLAKKHREQKAIQT